MNICDSRLNSIAILRAVTICGFLTRLFLFQFVVFIAGNSRPIVKIKTTNWGKKGQSKTADCGRGKYNMVFVCIFLLLTTPIEAADAPVKLTSIHVDLRDKAKLQRGAKIFMNYCSGCHSLQYMRYNKMAKDLGLTTFDGEVDKDLLRNNLIFTRANIHDPIQISMPKQDAEQWFGIVPPDLTLTARERGAEWIYTYLKSFYVDESRPFGTNNALVPDVAMPNVLAPLQGTVIAVHKGANGHERSDSSLVLIAPGRMGQQQFDSVLTDLVTFLVYVGEPSRLIRYQMGFFVLIFLIALAVLAYKLKKLYWKSIHKD